MASIDLSPRDPKSPEDDSHHDPNEDTTNDSSCSMVTDDNRSSLLSSDSASSPRPGLPQTPPRYDTEPPSIQVGHTLSRDDQQFWPNSHDPQTPSCSTHSEYLGPGLANPSTEFALESPSPYITNPDTSTVILQPPAHAQSQPHVLIAKPSIQQVQTSFQLPLSFRSKGMSHDLRLRILRKDHQGHLSDKHKIPLSTQPRRTHLDNDANRPKTEEDRRERTWESKRRWARKTELRRKPREIGKGTRWSLRCSTPSPSRRPYSIVPRIEAKRLLPPCTHHRMGIQRLALQNTSLPLNLILTVSHRNPTLLDPPCQSGPVAQVTFSHYPAMSAHASLSLANVPYSPLFPIGQGSAPSEWYLHSANSKPSSYPFGNYSAPTDTHFTFQLSDRFNAEGNHSKGNHSSYSPPFSQTRSLHQSPPTTYGTAVNQQESDDRRELPDCYTSAPLIFQYHTAVRQRS
ncbi:hypothetical protein Pst134EA_004897 [Puccinia striiformis f. sp. tritici]|uniref:hypothetical protein n=1 Tax=Puccinia striiformis f. sp. tritici TaxID=168172 RepID=UPI0020076912|nr:hypothetical protein Pst134EA_004897 [Puccinia striiformis f. sp. tritici]KAH9470987.1 hypothetical protein Pst134EA_004897 [Puccinia striiformis f. sp. tritici]